MKFERATDTYTTQSDDSCDILGLCLHTRDTFFSHNVYSTRNTKRRGKKYMICMNVTAFSDERRELGRWSPRDANTNTLRYFDVSYDPRDTLGRADNHHNPMCNSTLNCDIYKISDTDATFKRALVRVHDIHITNTHNQTDTIKDDLLAIYLSHKSKNQ